jgi:glutaredoxin
VLTLYTKSFCDKCDDIKKRLNDKGVEYLEKNSEEPETLQGLIPLLSAAGLKNPILPVLEFDDGSVVSNDMGLYKELRQRGIL